MYHYLIVYHPSPGVIYFGNIEYSIDHKFGQYKSDLDQLIHFLDVSTKSNYHPIINIIDLKRD